MISINLNKSKKKSGRGGGRSSPSASSGGGGGGGGFSLVDLVTKVREKLSMGGKGSANKESYEGEGFRGFIKSPAGHLLLGALAAVAIVIVTEDYKKSEIDALDLSIKKIETENNKRLSELQKYAGSEVRKKQLESTELIMRNKLEVLGLVMNGRDRPAKIMLHISREIPADLWLTELKLADSDVNFVGQTVRFGSVSDFLKSMSSTSYFSDVNLKEIKENSVLSKDEIKYQDFIIQGKRTGGLDGKTK